MPKQPASEATVTACDYCGSAFLDPEEAADPYRDENGNPMCHDCYQDHFRFDCCWCGEDEDNEYQDEIGCLLVVTDEDGAGITAGLYEITKRDYFTQSLIGSGWIHEWAVKRIGDVPSGINTDDYPCGHLCRGCAYRAKKQVGLIPPATRRQHRRRDFKQQQTEGA